MAKVTKFSSGEKTWTSEDLKAREALPFTVPARDASIEESIVCGFRASIIEANVGKEKLGGVDAGAGFGNPWIMIEWKGKYRVVHAQELLRAFVAEVAPEDLALFDK